MTELQNTDPKNTTNNNEPPIDLEQQKRGRRLFLFMFVLFFGPFLVAALAKYYGWFAIGDTVNYGKLVTPSVQISDMNLAVSNRDKKPVVLREKWSLLLFIPQDCNEVCLKSVREVEAIHLLLNRDIQRVQLLAINNAGNEPGLYRHDLIDDANLQTLKAEFATAKLANVGAYFIDPKGFLVLQYPQDVDGKRLQKILSAYLNILESVRAMTEETLDKIIIPAKENHESQAATPQLDNKPIYKASPRFALWYKRFTGFALLLALFVVVLGAWVRLTDAGLGCPDWPGCYGQIDVPRTADEIAAASEAYPGLEVETSKAWNEMLHRYVASSLGFLILILTFIAFKVKQNRLLTTVLLGMVIFQGLLGMWTVTLLLKPVIVMGHLLGGLTVTTLLFWLYLRQAYPLNHPGINKLYGLASIGLVILIGQIALGGWTSTNYAATACPDFPTCQAQWWPEEMDFDEGFVMWRGLGVNYEGGVLENPARVAIHFTHRLWAIITFVYIIFLGILAMRHSWSMRFNNAGTRLKRSAIAMKTLLLVQVAVAIIMVKQAFPLGVSTAHNGFAALLLLSTFAVLYFSSEND